MNFGIAALTVVLLGDRAAFWSLLYFGKLKVSSPTAQVSKKRQLKGPQSGGAGEQADEDKPLSILGGKSTGEAA